MAYLAYGILYGILYGNQQKTKPSCCHKRQKTDATSSGKQIAWNAEDLIVPASPQEYSGNPTQEHFETNKQENNRQCPDEKTNK